jgi:hypothetical protein
VRGLMLRYSPARERAQRGRKGRDYEEGRHQAGAQAAEGCAGPISSMDKEDSRFN